jgi:hypothetical protein
MSNVAILSGSVGGRSSHVVLLGLSIPSSRIYFFARAYARFFLFYANMITYEERLEFRTAGSCKECASWFASRQNTTGMSKRCLTNSRSDTKKLDAQITNTWCEQTRDLL